MSREINMGAQTGYNAAQAFIRAAVKSKPIIDSTGNIIFKYNNTLFYLGLILAALIMLIGINNPPNSIFGVFSGVILGFVAIYMCLESKKYSIALVNNVIIRHSPWPWHRTNKFHLEEITKIKYSHSFSLFKLQMENGNNLNVSIGLNGMFHLINKAIETANPILTKDTKFILSYYKEVPNKRL